MKIKSVVFTCASLFIVGCATTYKDFKTSDVKPKEGVVIGKVNIHYNGKNMNKDCAVCLNSVNGPCQGLTDEGLIFKNVPVGEASIRRIVCKDTSMQHYNIDGAKFRVANGVNYFGQVDIDWTNEGGFKSSDLFGLVGALISESKTDGAIKLTVKEVGQGDVVKAYEKQTGQDKVAVLKNIVKAVQ